MKKALNECLRTKETFENMTGIKWNNLEDSLNKLLTCFACENEISVAWASNC